MLKQVPDAHRPDVFNQIQSDERFTGIHSGSKQGFCPGGKLNGQSIRRPPTFERRRPASASP
jgi:hypothetical protein